jgi:hypothetical protein
LIKHSEGHYQVGEAHLCHADAEDTCAACDGKGKQGRKKCRACYGKKTQSCANNWATRNGVRFGWTTIGARDLDDAVRVANLHPGTSPGLVYYMM